MEIFAIVFLFVSALVALFILYLLIRNERVYDFRVKMNHICAKKMKDCDWEEGMKMWDSIMDEPTYDDMLFSFKSLIPKYWYNDEQLKFMGLK